MTRSRRTDHAPTSSKSAAGCGQRGYVASNDGNISVRLDDRPADHHAEERVEGLHDPRHDGDHRFRRAQDLPAIAMPSSELKMHLRGVSRSAGCERRGPRASADRHGLCRGRHPARSRGARGSHHHARQHSDRGVCDAVDRRTAGGVQQVPEGARRAAARQPRRAGDRRRICSRRITGWRRSSTSRRSAWWRARSAAKTCSRARKCSGCRDCAGCTASRRRRRSAPTTADVGAGGRWNARWCRRRRRRRARLVPDATPALPDVLRARRPAER